MPLHCIPADAMSFEAEIVEISRGGMAVMVYESTINLAPGRVLRECKLVVPGQVPIVVDLEVRNTNPIALPGVGPTRRAGLRILDRSVGIAALFRVLGADPAAG